MNSRVLFLVLGVALFGLSACDDKQAAAPATDEQAVVEGTAGEAPLAEEGDVNFDLDANWQDVQDAAGDAADAAGEAAEDAVEAVDEAIDDAVEAVEDAASEEPALELQDDALTPVPGEASGE